ncbi:MAG: hypothetical protein UR98_C0001G0042 [Parcubacteria group bacterium GW2011_GWA1_36_12]|nr:MAG: hypothetical protein UR98_C0001G0042 [Parcubacteria group bacterium GW2011_GWA1_36_12]
MQLISACLSFILLVSSLFPVSAIAQSNGEIEKVSGGRIDEALAQTVPTRFLPNQHLYFLITLKESVTRFFKPSARERAEFDFIISGKRLKETYMLSKNNNLNEARKNLNRYVSRLNKMRKQIEKARAQNQDIAKQIDSISEGFESHKTFLIYFLGKNDTFGQELIDSVEAFDEAVRAIDIIKPGITNRFQILSVSEKDDGSNLNQTNDSQISPILNEASPSFNPRRIIY